MKRFDCVVAGDINPDITMYTAGHMPRPGIEILAEGMALALGGSSCLTGAALSALGVKTALCARVGDDFYGRMALKMLEGSGVDASHIVLDRETPTGVTVSVTSPDDRAMITYLGTTARFSAEDVPLRLLEEARHLHVGGFYLLGNLRPSLGQLFGAARACGATTSLDTGWDDSGRWDGGLADVLRHVDFFFPNESEAVAITGCASPEAAAKKLSALGPTVVVKMGERGSILARGGQVVASVPACTVNETFNLTGAGDNFNAGFLYGYLKGRPMEECMRLGAANGAWRITRPRDDTSRQTGALIEQIARDGRI